ncbi:MAG: hypothetical protein P8016_02775 [Sedimentisphaerales bacterium]
MRVFEIIFTMLVIIVIAVAEQQLYDQWKNKYRFDYGYRLQSLGADGIKGGSGENADTEQFIGLVKNENKGDS